MATLAAIMREQEDERLARQFMEQEQKYFGEDSSSSQAADGLSEEDQLALALALSAVESEPQLDTDYSVALEEQEIADAQLAVQLQAQERGKLENQVHGKNMTILERKLYNMEIVDGLDDDVADDEEYDDDEEVLNALGMPLDNRVHDRAQRREDADITTGPYRRVPQKTVNSITQGSGTIAPLHHQQFTTRNVGKKDKDQGAIVSLQAKQSARRIFRGPETDEEVYGFVMQMYGGNHIEVLCLDAKSRQCSIPGKLQQRREWIRPGDAVLVRVRSYQPDRGDVQLRYDFEEHLVLIEEGELDLQIVTEALTVLTPTQRESLLDLMTREPSVADHYMPLKSIDWNNKLHPDVAQ